MKPIAIDLFCGAGGMSEGLIQAGFHIIFSNEISKQAAFTYKKRHEQLGLIQGKNTWLEVDDIKNISGDLIKEKIKKLEDFKNKNIEIAAIFGGPPCQGFSRAGKQKIDDIRNFLFSEYLRVVKEVKPQYIVFENVPGILDIKFHNFISKFDKEIYKQKSAIDIIKKELAKIDYELLDYKILNAADYGVPQNRHRVILIGYRKGQKIPNYPQKLNNEISLGEALGDITGYSVKNLEYQISSKKGRTPNIISGIPIESNGEFFNNDKSKHYHYIQERFSIFKEGESNIQLRKRLLTAGIEIENYPNLLEYLSNKLNLRKQDIIRKAKKLDSNLEILDSIITKKNSRVKMKLNKPGNTVLTLPDDLILPIYNRICSVREFARLQSFDDSFIFYGKRTTGGKERKKEVPQYTQVGNAVPPLLAKAIAEEIKKVL
ncbi:DNA cytosine methyltransferase [Fusobacterium mortiferum]|uniref:DNA cytosine methyltransferase n=1 Tax=Fusobacterium mortiferum TaxID=850 RepID=UPI00158D0900|nr:DNA cytosine methyltransferase [Fusobacterium mortiferum]